MLRTKNINGETLLAETVALLERDPTCHKTGLAKALRELTTFASKLEDSSMWLGVRLQDYWPPSESRPCKDIMFDGLVMKFDAIANIRRLPSPRLHRWT